MKLDSKTVAGLKLPSDKTDVIHFDSALSGFGYRLRAGSGGDVRRSWIAQYRRAGATRRILLGSAEVLNADQARAAAKKVLAKVALGEDPQADKASRRQRDAHTLAALIDDYLAAKESIVRPRSFTETTRYLRGPYFKPLHGVPVDRITRRDIAARVLVITRDSGATTAARARTALSAMLSWGVASGLVETNATIGTPVPKEPPPRDRVLDDAELAAVWSAAGDDDFGRIVRLLILTGQRRTEVGGAISQEFDLERGTWTIPSARSKNGRAHTLPLSALALSIISSAPRRVGRDHLFGDRGPDGFTSWAWAKRYLDDRLGDRVKPFTLHDLRRTFCTRLADLGVLPHTIEAAINHQSGHKRGPAGTYNRSIYVNEVRAAMAMWSDHVRSLIEGGERKILPLQRVP